MRKLKSLVVAAVASLLVLTGCNISVDFNGESEYKVMVEMDDGRLILPAAVNVGAARSFLMDMQEDRDYHFVIENFGGSAYDAMTIINRIEELQRKGFKVTTETYGYNMSAGTIIFLAGDIRIIHSDSTLMLHGAGFNSFGGRSSLKNPAGLTPFQIKSLELLDEKFISMLEERTLMNSEEVNEWMYAEHYNFMSSKEAMKLQVATEVR